MSDRPNIGMSSARRGWSGIVLATESWWYNLEAQYFLSKRTDLYGQVGFVRNRGLMSTGFNSGVSGTGGLPTGTTVGIKIGLMHTF